MFSLQEYGFEISGNKNLSCFRNKTRYNRRFREFSLAFGKSDSEDEGFTRIGLHVLIVIFLFVYSPELSATPIRESAMKFTVSGYLKDQENGEVLIGATVYIKELGTGVVSNSYGFYSISMVPGSYSFRYSYVGYEPQEHMVIAEKNLTLNLYLVPVQEELGEVIVKGNRMGQNLLAPEMSMVKISRGTIGKVPALLGEVDLVKVIQLLPGVQTTSEGTTGFSVRGGNADQNLIILDEATVYNASHLMGFFSVFNNDAVKEVTLYKGDVPAAYGGRLSSLLDIRMRDGNARHFAATGSIGTVSSKLTLEGPVIKDQTTFLFSGRRTYADLFLPLAKNEEIHDNRLYFYDLNLKLAHQVDDKNRLFLSGYSGRDIFKNQFALMGFGNQTASLRWNHLFSPKLFFNLTLLSSGFDYELGTLEEAENSFKWTSRLRDYAFRADFTHYLSVNHTLRYGFQSVHHRFSPGDVRGIGEQTRFSDYILPEKRALEHALYLSEEMKVAGRLTLKAGIRLALFQNLGPGVYHRYDENYLPADSMKYGKGEIITSYFCPEPRLVCTFPLNELSSVKGSMSRTAQFLMLAQNSTAGTPLDIWFPSSPHVKPQGSDQAAIGYFRNSKNKMFEFSAEGYYKVFRQVIDFKDHAWLILNKYLEGELRSGRGRAYGIETMVRKSEGRLTGWISYTWARSFRKIPEINHGKSYPAPFDKPHTVNFVASYDPGRRLSGSVTWVYATGLPATFPTGRAFIGDVYIPVYSARNEYRMPDYHRMDLSLTYRGKNKPGRKWHGEWNLSVYNVYDRHNTWSVNFVQDETRPDVTYAEKTYLFSVIPALTYNFRF